MNQDEKIAISFLESRWNDVVFEPDGNIPPDASIKGSQIGVEIRRLNQQYKSEIKNKGLEERRIPLMKMLHEELNKYPEVPADHCYWLSIYYEGDLDKIRKIKRKLHQSLDQFEKNGENYPVEYNLGRGVHMKIRTKGASGTNSIKKYKLATEIDNDSGGYITQIYANSIQHCLDEKVDKIMPYIQRYNEWWLLLVDRIGFFKYDDLSSLSSYVKLSKKFKKILIIDPAKLQLIKEI